MNYDDCVSLDEARKRLGLKSDDTVKNWLCGGYFPGAFQDSNGQWMFSKSNLEDVVERIDEIEKRNYSRDFTLPDDDDIYKSINYYD